MDLAVAALGQASLVLVGDESLVLPLFGTPVGL